MDEDEREGLHDDLGLRPESRVERRANQRRARNRRGFGCFAGLVSLLVVGGLIGGLAFGFGKGRDALEKVFSAPDYSGTGTTAVTVEITQGQSAQSIADTLEKKGVVKSARAFERAARDNAKSRSIQAATYTLKKEMSAKAALELLLDPAKSVLVTRIGFPSGRTKAEITAILQKAKAAKLPAGAAAAAMSKPWSLGLPSYAKNNPEGFLYPGTYDVPKGATAFTILKLMTTQFAKTSAVINLPATAQRKKVDPYQVVIIASIITAETNRKEDYGKVARVIYNRLAAGEKLQMDSTIHYVVGRNGKVFTSDADRQMDSPYNTYLHAGLPPTPINSPGRETLQAALNPTPGGWKFFTLVNLDTGETAFSSSASEHQQNVRKLQAWCAAHAGRC
ncbi:endolytic transglycosylase MltG [Kribbella qitaiheensis]|uniref:endolytic transglycosylase MltG n=1 Tax=Kribbella qitaiheensis TaxID=1544730 RepID=UPI001FE2D26D|nr:endolytic transglycosylase MltG [Kribbella qitaiheensis]